MDFFAHGFWSFIIFHKKRYRWLALFFGLLPDISSWFIFFWYNLFTHTVDWTQNNPDFSNVPQWTWTLYNISHSLVVWTIFILIAWFIVRKFPWPVLAGPLMILFDIPTHTRDFLPTPFLWPLSDWRFPGFSWGQWWFMILNYGSLIILYSYFFIYRPWREGKPREKAMKEKK